MNQRTITETYTTTALSSFASPLRADAVASHRAAVTEAQVNRARFLHLPTPTAAGASQQQTMGPARPATSGGGFSATPRSPFNATTSSSNGGSNSNGGWASVATPTNSATGPVGGSRPTPRGGIIQLSSYGAPVSEDEQRLIQRRHMRHLQQLQILGPLVHPSSRAYANHINGNNNNDNSAAAIALAHHDNNSGSPRYHGDDGSVDNDASWPEHGKAHNAHASDVASHAQDGAAPATAGAGAGGPRLRPRPPTAAPPVAANGVKLTFSHNPLATLTAAHHARHRTQTPAQAERARAIERENRAILRRLHDVAGVPAPVEVRSIAGAPPPPHLYNANTEDHGQPQSAQRRPGTAPQRASHGSSHSRHGGAAEGDGDADGSGALAKAKYSYYSMVMNRDNRSVDDSNAADTNTGLVIESSHNQYSYHDSNNAQHSRPHTAHIAHNHVAAHGQSTALTSTLRAYNIHTSNEAASAGSANDDSADVSHMTHSGGNNRPHFSRPPPARLLAGIAASRRVAVARERRAEGIDLANYLLASRLATVTGAIDVAGMEADYHRRRAAASRRERARGARRVAAEEATGEVARAAARVTQARDGEERGWRKYLDQHQQSGRHPGQHHLQGHGHGHSSHDADHDDDVEADAEPTFEQYFAAAVSPRAVSQANARRVRRGAARAEAAFAAKKAGIEARLAGLLRALRSRGEARRERARAEAVRQGIARGEVTVGFGGDGDYDDDYSRSRNNNHDHANNPSHLRFPGNHNNPDGYSVGNDDGESHGNADDDADEDMRMIERVHLIEQQLRSQPPESHYEPYDSNSDPHNDQGYAVALCSKHTNASQSQQQQQQQQQVDDAESDDVLAPALAPVLAHVEQMLREGRQSEAAAVVSTVARAAGVRAGRALAVVAAASDAQYRERRGKGGNAGSRHRQQQQQYQQEQEQEQEPAQDQWQPNAPSQQQQEQQQQQRARPVTAGVQGQPGNRANNGAAVGGQNINTKRQQREVDPQVVWQERVRSRLSYNDVSPNCGYPFILLYDCMLSSHLYYL